MIKTKVLFLLHDTRVQGGANSSLFDAIKGLIGEIDVYIAIPKMDEEMICYLNNNKLKWFLVRYPSWIYKKNRPIHKRFIKLFLKLFEQYKILLSLRQIHSIIIENKIDLIYTNTYSIYIGCLVNKIWGIKHIWHIREFGYEDHGFGIVFGNHIITRMFNKYTDKIIFISESLKCKYDPMIENKDKTYVIYDDISKALINNEKTKKAKKECINILVAGLIQEGKGQLDVLKAFKICSNTKNDIYLYIAGETGNSYYNKLKEFIEKNNLGEKVFFLGFVKDMNKLRSKMDIGIVASQSEAFGRVTIEGMLSNMAMIGANAGATTELIRNEITGLLYETGNIEDLAEKITFLINNETERNKLSSNAFENAVKQFTSGKCAEKILEIIYSC